MRRRALRHGYAGPARRVRTRWGSGPISSGRRRSIPCGASIHASGSWPRSTGIGNGPCSSTGSTTRRQATVRPLARGAGTAGARSSSTPGSISRTGSPASWRTTTSRGVAATFSPDMHEAAAVITFLSPGMRFFHQGRLRGADAPRPSWCAGRRKRSIRGWNSFSTGCLAVLVAGGVAREIGDCSTARRPGKEIGRRLCPGLASQGPGDSDSR